MRWRSVRGYMLVEALLTSLVVSIALVALVSVTVMTVKANLNSEATNVSAYLSQKLLEEIRLRKWDERTPTPPLLIRNSSAIGLDGGGESATDKTTYNDVDDFNGWTEAPPRDPLMRGMAGFTEYSSSVSVRYVNIATLAPTGKRTDFKQISVCTWRKNRKSICLDTLFTNR